jgi:hypothetical protein
MPKCSYDPKEYANAPIGMFHCPDCGEMVIAGMEHPEWDNLEDSSKKYFDGQYEKMKEYFKGHLGQVTFDAFILFIESMPNMKGTILEIWERASHTFKEDHHEPK